MALQFPDIIEHNNPANPLMDDGQLKGGLMVVVDKTARNAIPINKRKINAVVSWQESGQVTVKKYNGIDITNLNWTDDNNWEDITSPFYSFDLTQTLLANNITTFVIGDKTKYPVITLHYQMVRDSIIASGIIEILQNKSSLETPVFYTFREFGGSIGLVDITSSFNGNNIELSIEIDNSSASDVILTYDLEYISFVPGWVQQTSPVTTGLLFGIDFINDNVGWTVGMDSGGNILILNTTDGGANWVQQTSPVINGILYGVSFVDINHGWAVGSNGTNVVILNTTDGGANWVQQTSPVTISQLFEVIFIDDNNGWVCGYDGSNNPLILHTNNGGINWIQQSVPFTLAEFNSIYFLDANNGWACGYDADNDESTIIHTSDGGANWIKQTVPGIIIGSNILSIYFYNINIGWALHLSGGDQIVIYTNDGGINWTAISTFPPGGSMNKLNFLDANHGLFVGYDGSSAIAIYNTIDGGTTLIRQTSPVALGGLNDVKYISENIAYAVGSDDSGNIVILKYS